MYLLIADPPHSAMNRRPDYWIYCHLRHSSKTSFMIYIVANLVRGTRVRAKRRVAGDHTGVRDRPEQHQRCDHVAVHAGRDETTASIVCLSCGPVVRLKLQLPDTVQDRLTGQNPAILAKDTDSKTA